MNSEPIDCDGALSLVPRLRLLSNSPSELGEPCDLPPSESRSTSVACSSFGKPNQTLGATLRRPFLVSDRLARPDLALWTSPRAGEALHSASLLDIDLDLLLDPRIALDLGLQKSSPHQASTSSLDDPLSLSSLPRPLPPLLRSPSAKPSVAFVASSKSRGHCSLSLQFACALRRSWPRLAKSNMRTRLWKVASAFGTLRTRSMANSLGKCNQTTPLAGEAILSSPQLSYQMQPAAALNLPRVTRPPSTRHPPTPPREHRLLLLLRRTASSYDDCDESACGPRGTGLRRLRRRPRCASPRLLVASHAAGPSAPPRSAPARSSPSLLSRLCLLRLRLVELRPPPRSSPSPPTPPPPRLARASPPLRLAASAPPPPPRLPPPVA